MHFHLLHPKTQGRVREAWRGPTLSPGEQKMARAGPLHGYGAERGQRVLVGNIVLKSMRLESPETIKIERFVDAS